MGTRDYRIALEAIPLETGQTFIHLAFSNAYGSLGRLAMQAYFATTARDRVGFTVLDTQPDGRLRHVGGMRGAVERNAMRYYLAIESYLGALSGSPQARFEKRIHAWYEASERYPRQLHEMEQGDYLDMKRKENARRLAASGLTALRSASCVPDPGWRPRSSGCRSPSAGCPTKP